jgi:hypothetical protein
MLLYNSFLHYITPNRAINMKKLIFTVIVLAGFITGCATVPTDDISIETEADPKVNFSGYKTYAWLGSVGIVNDPEGQWEPPNFDADATIMSIADDVLSKRGMSKVDSEPDMVIAYALGVDMEALEVKVNPDTKLTTLEDVPQAGLVMIMLDPETQFVTWIGIATAEVKNLDTEMVQKRLEYAVKGMLKKLPK